MNGRPRLVQLAGVFCALVIAGCVGVAPEPRIELTPSPRPTDTATAAATATVFPSPSPFPLLTQQPIATATAQVSATPGQTASSAPTPTTLPTARPTKAPTPRPTASPVPDPGKLTVFAGVANCGIPCWGAVTGDHLAPNTPVAIYRTKPTSALLFDVVVDPIGGVNAGIDIECGTGYAGVYAVATTALGNTITSNKVKSPCEPSLKIDNSSYPCNGSATCWGTVKGSWLAPSSNVTICYPDLGCLGSVQADSDGNVTAQLNLSCGSNSGISATGTGLNNDPITAPPANSPC